MNPFDTVKAIYTGQKCKLKNTYVVNRIFSFLPQTFLASKAVNDYASHLPPWAIKGIYDSCIEKKKSSPFVPYQKAVKQNESKLVTKISEHLCCSNAHATQTIALLKLEGYKPESFFGLKEGE